MVAPPGTRVMAGNPVVIVESMKMEIPVEAPADGTVAEILVAEGGAAPPPPKPPPKTSAASPVESPAPAAKKLAIQEVDDFDEDFVH